jgi:hypothetical protein
VIGPDGQLHGHPERTSGGFPLDLHRLEILEQAEAAEPRRPVAARDHVVPMQRAQRDRVELRVPEQPGEVGAGRVEDLFVEIDEIHLVHRENEARDPEEPRNLGVPAGLVADAVPRVDEENRDIRRRRPGRHVARVLLVAGSVGQNPLAARRGEVPVRHVDGDALLALRLEPVREEREINRAGAAVPRRRGHRANLVLVDTARIVEQPPDERALPIVHAPGGADAEEPGHQKYPSRFFISMELS